jgi:hypothetical protein
MKAQRKGGFGRRFGRLGGAAGMLVALAACGPQSNPQTFLDAMGPDANGSADLAMAALARGDYAAAERNVDMAIKRDPHNPYALLAGGMLYQSTNRPLRARQMYEDLLSLRPNQAATVVGWDPSRVMPLADIANANMGKVDADLRRAGVMPALASAATPGLTAPAVAPVDAAPIQALDPRTQAIAERFKTLQKLRDEQLITAEEYAARRNANLGALLPLTKTPPAAGLDRPVPALDQVVDRLKALQRGLQSRAITPREYEMERETILDALLPAKPVGLAAPEAAPRDLLASAERMRQLERLRTQGLITDPEMKAEQAALEAALRTSPSGAVAAPGAAPNGPRMLVPGGSASSIATSPLAPPLPGQTTVHLASYRTEAQAQIGWDDLVKRFPRQLTTLAPEIRKAPVAGKPDNYRLYAGPFAARTEAAAVCKALAAKRQFCSVTND